jgi:NTP pyrophosphatase (non-canonical NTP hydrolase)
MNFSEYQVGTEFTWNTHERSATPADLPLLNAALGVAGEAGELADLVKKDVFHGVPADPDKVLKELGDVLYYITRVADAFGFTLEQVAQTNHDKLKARYPEGFKLGGGIR